MQKLIFFLVFALLWWIMVYFHGDTQMENVSNDDWVPCITGIQNFTSAFLFSLETQQVASTYIIHAKSIGGSRMLMKRFSL